MSEDKPVHILIWHDKHGDFTFGGPDAALKILKERLDNDYLNYPDDAEDRAKEIIIADDEAAALDFLRQRNDYEYERLTEERLR